MCYAYYVKICMCISYDLTLILLHFHFSIHTYRDVAYLMLLQQIRKYELSPCYLFLC